jgi:hypothetical protein
VIDVAHIHAADPSSDAVVRMAGRDDVSHCVTETPSSIVDLISGTVEVYRGPSATGYDTKDVVRRGGRVAPLTFPSLVLGVDDILG